MTEATTEQDTTGPLTEDPPSDDNGGTASTPERARRGQQARKLIEYGVYLDGAGVAIVGGWEAEHATSLVFCDQQIHPDVTPQRYARCVGDRDLLCLDIVDAVDRDAAGEKVRNDPAPNERVKVVQAYYAAINDVDLKVNPTSSVGEVPLYWDHTPRPMIGKRP